MNFVEIIEEIKSGLKGDTLLDMSYLREQSIKYSGHECEKEILMEIGKLSFEAITNKDKDITKEDLDKEGEEIKKQYNQAVRLTEDKRFLDASKILETVIEKIRNKTEAGNTTFSFGTSLKLWLYVSVFKPEQMINQSVTDNSSIYKLYGYNLAQLFKIDEAIKALEEGLKWEPVNVSILIELGEISRLRGEYDKFLGVTRNALLFATSRFEISKCYYRLAVYYDEIKDYKTAITLYHLSNSFERNTPSEKRLLNMKVDLGLKVELPNPEKVNKLLKEKEIPLCPSEYVINAVLTLAKESKENGNIEIYKYCKDVYKDLTEEEISI